MEITPFQRDGLGDPQFDVERAREAVDAAVTSGDSRAEAAALVRLATGLQYDGQHAEAVATFGFAMHWSCLIVATVLAAVGAAAFAKGRADAAEDLTPNRTIHQVKQDIAIAKEQLS